MATAEREGLTDTEAAARLAEDGPNELPQSERRTLVRLIVEVLREPMLALLLASGAIYLLLGELKDSLVLVVFALLSVIITIVQEARTERVLESLRDLTSPRALVIRGGVRRRVPGRDLVRGDLVALSEGDRVPADAMLIEAQDLQTDESLLTGESMPVHKVAGSKLASWEPVRPGGDGLAVVFSGSLIVRGRGLGEVVSTGPRSEIGKIGVTLSQLQTEPPRLQLQTRRLVTSFAIFGGVASALAVLLYGLLRGGWIDGLLAGIALGMSMLPEEFPVVLTVFMAMGAWRISRARVLTRHAAAIETLGSATVLCTDKTGTLTENRMSVAELRLPSGAIILPSTAPSDELDLLIQTSVLASAPNPFDPMEKAIHESADANGHSVPNEWTIAKEYGLTPDLLAVAQGWRQAGNSDHVIAAKGAPEAIAALCQFDEEQERQLAATVDDMATKGLRVLGVARGVHHDHEWPQTARGFVFDFVGLVGLADPLRENVPEAVRQCRTAGIRVVMITGDYPETARSIARQAGLDIQQLLTGDDLSRIDDATLRERVKATTVFARIMPEQKLRIVHALKANGEIVAMTGDGVNDAPSLKAAHIGVAMGGRGTDVAREASSIVLLDDDFGSIVEAIRMGRRIYDNLRKAMAFIFAVHVPIAGLALIPLLFGLPIIFWPVHIAFLEMVIDPVSSLVFEAETEETDVMSRPPRPPDEPLFTRRLILWSLFQGALVLAVVSTIYVTAYLQGVLEGDLRALTFISLTLAIISLVLVNRSFSASLIAAFSRPNPALLAVAAAIASMLAVTLLWPLARSLFGFGSLPLSELSLTVLAGLTVLLLLEWIKRVWRGQLLSPATLKEP